MPVGQFFRRFVRSLLMTTRLGIPIDLAPEGEESRNPQRRRHIDLLDFMVGQGVSSGDRVLDVGCGKGFLSVKLHEAGYKNIVSVDWLERSALSNGFIRRGIEYHQIDLNRDQLGVFPSQSFDVVVCSDVLEHLENPASLMREISRVVKEPASVFVTIPNAFNIFERVTILFTGNSGRYKIEKAGEYGHISMFTDNILQSLLERVGLRVAAEGRGYCLFGGLFLFFQSKFGPLFSYVRYLHIQRIGTCQQE